MGWRNSRFRRRCKWDLRSSGVLRNVIWELVAEVSGQTSGPIFKGQSIQEEILGWTAWPLKMGPIGCPKTSVTNKKSTFYKIPEERRSQAWDSWISAQWQSKFTQGCQYISTNNFHISCHFGLHLAKKNST